MAISTALTSPLLRASSALGEGHGAVDAFDGGLRTGEVDVDDGGNFGAVDAGAEPLDVVRAHAACADDGHAEDVSHCSVLW